MSARENEVRVSLRGRPRWWTLTNKAGTREIVRLEVDIDLEGETAKELIARGHHVFTPMPVWIIIPPGLVKWPPISAVGWFLGSTAHEEMGRSGMKIFHWGTKTALKLEESLVGYYDDRKIEVIGEA